MLPPGRECGIKHTHYHHRGLHGRGFVSSQRGKVIRGARRLGIGKQTSKHQQKIETTRSEKNSVKNQLSECQELCVCCSIASHQLFVGVQEPNSIDLCAKLHLARAPANNHHHNTNCFLPPSSASTPTAVYPFLIMSLSCSIMKALPKLGD